MNNLLENYLQVGIIPQPRSSSFSAVSKLTHTGNSFDLMIKSNPSLHTTLSGTNTLKN